jgi:hypothetical protein
MNHIFITLKTSFLIRQGRLRVNVHSCLLSNIPSSTLFLLCWNSHFTSRLRQEVLGACAIVLYKEVEQLLVALPLTCPTNAG